jgi:hypothetical protein
MKTSHLKRYLLLLGITSLIIHFTLILVFCFQQHFSNSLLLKVSKKYVFPVFNQNWKMFAPEPPLSTRNLYYKCSFTDGSYSGWINPGTALLKKHQSNRFWNYGSLFIAYGGIHRELKYANDNLKYLLEKENIKPDSMLTAQRKEMIQTPQYKMAVSYFTNQAIQHFGDKQIDKIDFMYVASTLPSISNKTGNRTFEALIFPTIVIANGPE